jgi:hypothetical protein
MPTRTDLAAGRTLRRADAADPTVPGTVVGRTENMHRRYEVPVADALRPGRNTLTVRFDSAWAVGEAARERLGRLPTSAWSRCCRGRRG